MNCKENPFIEIDAKYFSISQFECKPLDGYVKPINKETNQEFPYCCSYHKSIFNNTTNWLEKFPNCCKKHKEEYKMLQFDKNKYKDLPMKVVSHLSYTEYHITIRIEADDWYKDIIDYIEYNVESFGHPNIGGSQYLNYLVHYLENKLTYKNITKQQQYKLLQILDFLQTKYSNNNKEKVEQTSLNLLYDTYRKWLAIFPFEISYFAMIKEKYKKTLPILKDEPVFNPYLNVWKAKLHTKSSLIEALINLTNKLLTEINGVILYEQNLINDIGKTRLEILCESRKLKIKQGYTNSSSNEEKRYIKILKEWFKDEKQFFEDLSKILNEKTNTTIIQNAEKIYNIDKIDNAKFS